MNTQRWFAIWLIVSTPVLPATRRVVFFEPNWAMHLNSERWPLTFTKVLTRQPPICAIWKRGKQVENGSTSIDDMISAVDVNGVASDEPGRIMSQERRCRANAFDADQAARRRFGLRFFK